MILHVLALAVLFSFFFVVPALYYWRKKGTPFPWKYTTQTVANALLFIAVLENSPR